MNYAAPSPRNVLISFVSPAIHVNRQRAPIGFSSFRNRTVHRLIRPRLSRSSVATTIAAVTANGVGSGSFPISSTISSDLSVNGKPTSLEREQRSTAVRFLQLAWSQWRLLIPALFAALAASLCAVIQPLLYGRIMGVISQTAGIPYSETSRRLIQKVSKLAIAYCIEVFCTICFVTLTARVFDRVTRTLREQLFTSTLRNDVGFFDETGRPDIERAIASEVKVVRDGIWGNLSRDRGIRAFFEVIFGLTLCIYVTGAKGAPIFGFLVPIVSVVVAQMGLRNGRVASRVERKESSFQSYLSERIGGLRTLKAFGAEKRENLKLRSVLDDSEKSANEFGVSKGLTEGANRVAIYVTIITFFTSGGLMICAGNLTFELFSCLTGFIWILNFAMQGISYTIADVAKVLNSLRSIYQVLDGAKQYSLARPVSHQKLSAQPHRFSGEVCFSHVHFYYPSRPDVTVLKDISFSIRPGEMVALVGDSGGGKSTIAAMLCRFYAPSSGVVTLDGFDVQSIPSERYTKFISVVDQDPVLFTGTIRENIAYGLPDEEVDHETIVRAAKEANAHEFIEKLPQGYDTLWGPGANVSGGQRQRIAIARSLVKSPRVLVLDEATSALDQESERIVQVALERIMKNRTVLIIAHRLSTVRSADKILFVKDGQIAEQGSYDDLIATPAGYFRALVESASALSRQSVPKL